MENNQFCTDKFVASWTDKLDREKRSSFSFHDERVEVHNAEHNKWESQVKKSVFNYL
jgi:hypothetical protein